VYIGDVFAGLDSTGGNVWNSCCYRACGRWRVSACASNGGSGGGGSDTPSATLVDGSGGHAHCRQAAGDRSDLKTSGVAED
jgi:hypothetical protein